MGLDRRDFMKALGVTGAALAVGKKSQASEPAIARQNEFYGMLYDATRCVGCQTCEVMCAQAHGLPEPVDSPEAGKIRQMDETRRTVVNAFETSKGEVFAKRQCMHCNQPACGAACLTQAMHKTQEGPVIWRGNKCMGCRYCMVSCPFDVPKFEYHSANPKIVKCDMCYDRVMQGQKPVCAENCPAEAILFGTRRELLAEARKRIAENPEMYVDHIYGETEAGGTGWLYLTPVEASEMGFKTGLQNSSYPALSKGFLYSVPSVFVLLPALLLGIHESAKNKENDQTGGEENEQ
jgi:formate dehydrogenase iron-sulfur subunit